MPTVTLSRSDLFPVGTSVGIYPPGSGSSVGGYEGPPRAAAIASGTVDAAGNLSVTNAGILSLTTYVAGAQVAGVWVYARVRSTLDTHEKGTVVGTGDTLTGSFTILNASASAGSFQIGQRLSGAGIRSGTRIVNVVGGTLAIDQPASATANGVAIAGENGGMLRSQFTRNATRRAAIGTT